MLVFVHRQQTETQPLMEITPDFDGLGVFLCAIARAYLCQNLNPYSLPIT